MMADPIPAASEPMTNDALQALLRRAWAPGHLNIAITCGPERIGHAIVSITDVPSDRIPEAVGLVARATPSSWQLHYLDDAALVTIEGTKP